MLGIGHVRIAAAWAVRRHNATVTAAAGVKELTISRPDDWHLHVRDGAGLQSVVPHTANVFKRAVIMPNLVPPLTSTAQVGRA
jgi:dihydroorotase